MKPTYLITNVRYVGFLPLCDCVFLFSALGCLHPGCLPPAQEQLFIIHRTSGHIKYRIEDACQAEGQNHIQYRMLLDEHGGQDDQAGHHQGCHPQTGAFPGQTAVLDRKPGTKGVVHVDAWQDVVGAVGLVQPGDHGRENIIVVEGCRAQLMAVGV